MKPTSTSLVGNGDAEYAAFQRNIHARFSANTNGMGPVFETDAAGLWEAYVAAFPAADRQYHTCHACRRFIERYGGLVKLDPNGGMMPLFWHEDDAPAEERASVAVMARIVRGANVIGPFLAPERIWGEPVTGIWHHLYIVPPPSMIHPYSAFEMMAQKREDFKNVSRALGEFPPELLRQALTLLESDSLYRSEKVAGPARWLADLQARRAAIANRRAKANIVWLAVATAPAGFCHPRSSMIGTLLEDLAAGMDFAQVSRRFAAKMHPTQYQRPTAAPAAATIAQAEKLVAQLGIERSLARRYARLDEIETMWRPAPKPAAGAATGVFGHLKVPTPSTPTELRGQPSQAMTWEKFARTVLPIAERIEYFVNSPDAFSAFTTAVDPAAPPILQWDSAERRNPFSWYFWTNGAPALQYGLKPYVFQELSAIALKPSMWGAGAPQHGNGVMFVIAAAKETRNAGLALFPETLRSELHGVRAVIEAHSRSAKLEGMEDASVCGVMACGKTWNVDLRVTVGGAIMRYHLDRWD